MPGRAGRALAEFLLALGHGHHGRSRRQAGGGFQRCALLERAGGAAGRYAARVLADAGREREKGSAAVGDWDVVTNRMRLSIVANSISFFAPFIHILAFGKYLGYL